MNVHVTLSGTVEMWSEYDMAEDVAWMTPGVTDVSEIPLSTIKQLFVDCLCLLSRFYPAFVA